jgi:hypothetical protein
MNFKKEIEQEHALNIKIDQLLKIYKQAKQKPATVKRAKQILTLQKEANKALVKIWQINRKMHPLHYRHHHHRGI